MVPLPPPDEQRRVAGILNRAAKIERLRTQAARRRAQERLREFLPALFVNMFGDPATNSMGWEVHPLGEFCISAQYGTSRKADDGVGVGGLPVIRMGKRHIPW